MPSERSLGMPPSLTKSSLCSLEAYFPHLRAQWGASHFPHLREVRDIGRYLKPCGTWTQLGFWVEHFFWVGLGLTFFAHLIQVSLGCIFNLVVNYMGYLHSTREPDLEIGIHPT